MKTAQTIGVIGAGAMGTGVAQECVVAGHSVVMIDVDEARLACARNAKPKANNVCTLRLLHLP